MDNVFYLVVGESNFNFKLIWHDKFVCFNRVIEMLWLSLILLLVLVSVLLLVRVHLEQKNTHRVNQGRALSKFMSKMGQRKKL